jgi:N-acetylneuraminic acid mutarotase
MNFVIFCIIAIIPCLSYFVSDSVFQMSYSEPTSFWSNGKNMPTPREEISGALLNGKIYIVGGSPDGNKITDNVDVYDTKADEWHSVASLPVPRDHIGVCSYDGKVYAVGGFDVKDRPTNELLIYDPQKNKWKYGSPMPTSRGALVAEFINGTLYAAGGVDATHNVISTLEAYDPQTNKWIARAPMPSARHHLSSAVVDGKLYVIGGRLLGDGIPRPINEALSNLNDNEVYDPQHNSWSILAPMPSKRSGLAAAPVNSSIYVLGGQSVNGTFDNNEVFNTKTKIWSSEIPMPTSRLGLEAIAVDDDGIYAIGGKLENRRVIGVNEIFHPVTIEHQQSK